MRLCLNICVPHQCRCGAQVDVLGVQSLICKQAPGKSVRHHALNDVVARAFSAADTPISKEPAGLCRTDGRRPDGISLIRWQAGKPAVWDVTVTCTTAASYLDSSSREAGAAAEIAASRKMTKYSNLAAQHTCDDAHGLLRDLGRRLSEFSGDIREVQFCISGFQLSWSVSIP